MKRFEFYAGIDGVAPIIHGDRVVQQQISQHNIYWKTDFQNVKRLGMDVLRWGPNWYEVNPRPGTFDWSHVDEQMEFAKGIGLEIWYVLQHKQIPNWLHDLADYNLTEALARYGAEVAKRYPELKVIVPQVEADFFCLVSYEWGLWHPHAKDKSLADFARSNMAQAMRVTSNRIKSLRPDVKIMHVEHADGVDYCRRLGKYVDVFGLDYYAWAHTQHDLVGWLDKWRAEIGEYEFTISEVDYAGGHCNHDVNFQAAFLSKCFEDCKEAISKGVNLTSMCWYPTVTDNLYWGTCLAHRYPCNYGSRNQFVGDDTGSFFRFRDENGLLPREASPTMVKTLWREVDKFREWETDQVIVNHPAVQQFLSTLT